MDKLPKDCTTRDAIRKIINLDIERNDAQKRYINNLDAQHAVLKLVTLGYREEAKKIAKLCFTNSTQNHNLKIAREMAEFLMNHEYKFGSLSEAENWEQHYLELDKTVRAQIKAKRMYGTVLNNYMMGLTLPKEDLKEMVDNLESNIKYDSVWYLYYYYQIKSLLYEGKELEQMLKDAITLFERRYIRHSNFVVAFKIELINYYRSNKEFAKAAVLIKEAISITTKDTVPFLNIKYIQTELFTDMGEYEKAVINYHEVKKSSIFPSISEERKMKWEILYRRITEEM